VHHLSVPCIPRGSNPYPDIHGDLELSCLWDLPGRGTWLKVPLGKRNTSSPSCWRITPGDASAIRRRHRRRGIAPRACRSSSGRPGRDRHRHLARGAGRGLTTGGGPGEIQRGQLAAAFPPRPVAASWPATEARRSAVVDRVLAAPFALDNPTANATGDWGCWRCWAGCVSGPASVGGSAARRRRRAPAGLAAGGRCRPRPAAAAPGLGAAGVNLRRCDPARPGLAAAVRPGPAQPGRREGPHPRSGRVRRAQRDVGAGSAAKPAAGADQHGDHHGHQGRKRRGGAGR
jgi:hypothetical protein